jgi:hypothetical protein
MNFWLIKPAESGLVAFIPDSAFAKQFGQAPNMIAKRQIISSSAYGSIELQVGRPNASAVETDFQKLPDMLVWGWLPIFSERAVTAMTAYGCSIDEFWPCRFETNPGEKYFFHLPEKHYDIIDFEKSKFRMTLPLDPPVPVHLRSLVTLPSTELLPPCFQVGYSHRDVVYPEVFVRNDFKVQWEASGFTGATFVAV